MAKSHVVQYFLEVENQYLEMLDNLKDFKQLASDNIISQEEYLNAVNEVEVLKTNYERIGYIMFLLNKPRRKTKKVDDKTLSWYKALQTSSKEAILDENRDALATLKQILDSKKEEKNEK